mmetsp:Transcript_12834/g.27222  ORF Transcript_12834/g.27222 Transcript_12834/m.27222 type:complete len:253 (+) Transcript_12834:122-880(+)
MEPKYGQVFDGTSFESVLSPPKLPHKKHDPIVLDNTNTNTNNSPPQQLELQVQLQTLSRILLPSLGSSLLAYLLFPPLALQLSYLINDSATFAVLSVDSSQFIQNFLTVTGLTFSILVGQTYYFMYQQQEAVFVSLFGEVTEAKSLLEQVALVCQGRRDTLLHLRHGPLPPPSPSHPTRRPAKEITPRPPPPPMAPSPHRTLLLPHPRCRDPNHRGIQHSHHRGSVVRHHDFWDCSHFECGGGIICREWRGL